MSVMVRSSPVSIVRNSSSWVVSIKELTSVSTGSGIGHSLSNSSSADPPLLQRNAASNQRRSASSLACPCQRDIILKTSSLTAILTRSDLPPRFMACWVPTKLSNVICGDDMLQCCCDAVESRCDAVRNGCVAEVIRNGCGCTDAYNPSYN